MKNYLGHDLRKIFREYIRQVVSSEKYTLRWRVKKRNEFVKLKTLKGIKQGRRTFVFGNGPSMRLLDAEKIAGLKSDGFDLWGCNSYLCSDFAKKAKPSHYLLSDPNWFSVGSRDIPDQMMKEIFASKEELGSLSSQLFVPFQYLDEFKTENVFGFNDSENIFSDNVVDITRPRGYNSIGGYKAIAIAAYLGYDKIYICGIDNTEFLDLSVDKNNNLFLAKTHFYGENKKYSFLRQRKIHEELYLYHLIFRQLYKFPLHKIINMDYSSYVDAFSKTTELNVYKDSL